MDDPYSILLPRIANGLTREMPAVRRRHRTPSFVQLSARQLRACSERNLAHPQSEVISKAKLVMGKSPSPFLALNGRPFRYSRLFTEVTGKHSSLSAASSRGVAVSPEPRPVYPRVRGVRDLLRFIQSKSTVVDSPSAQYFKRVHEAAVEEVFQSEPQSQHARRVIFNKLYRAT